MTSYKITFKGTDEQLLMGATANGYTGYKPRPYYDVPTAPEDMTQPEEETLNEFMARILMTTSPTDFVRIAVADIQSKKGTDNYDAGAMEQAMLGLLSIEPLVI